MVADVPVDVVPEPGMHRVRDHRAGTGQLALVTRRLVMLRDEAHRVEEREAQQRAQHQRQGLVEHAMTIRSEEHTYEHQSLMSISYAVFCWKEKRTEEDRTNISNER